MKKIARNSVAHRDHHLNEDITNTYIQKYCVYTWIIWSVVLIYLVYHFKPVEQCQCVVLWIFVHFVHQNKYIQTHTLHIANSLRKLFIIFYIEVHRGANNPPEPILILCSYISHIQTPYFMFARNQPLETNKQKEK